MEWREVIEHPSPKDLPFKIETDEWGKIIMAPASYAHGVYQGEIEAWLRKLSREGRISPECPVKTSKGTKVADVARASPALE